MRASRFDRTLPWALVAGMASFLLLGLTWNASFEATPANADLVSQGDDRIRELKVEIRDRVDEEHCYGSGGGSGCVTDGGLHREGSARSFYNAAAPTVLLNPVASALGANDAGRLWLDTDGLGAGTQDDRTLNIWTGAAWATVRSEVPTITVNAATITDNQIYDIGTISTTPATLTMAGGAGAGGIPSVTAPATGTWGIDVTGNFVVNRSGIVSASSSPRKFIARLQEQVAAGAFVAVAWCALGLDRDDSSNDTVGSCTYAYQRSAAVSTAYTYRIRVSIFDVTGDTDDLIIESSSGNHDVEAETVNKGYLRAMLIQQGS